MSNRRSFLGQVIGVLAGVPFVAKMEPVTRLPESLILTAHKINLCKEQGKGSKCVIHTDLGEFIIDQIKNTELKENSFRISFEFLEVNRTIQIEKFELLNKENISIINKTIAQRLYCGDKLNCTFTINW